MTINKLTEIKKLMRKISWFRFALGEGTAKAANKSIHKYFGGYINTTFTNERTAAALLIALIAGFVQIVGGLILAVKTGKKLIPARQQIIGSLTFGLIATLMTFLSVITFTYPGNDLAVATFLITLAIIPSRLLDRFIDKKKMLGRQYIGLALYLAVAYIFLKDFREPTALLSMPVWAWLSLAIGVLLSLNNFITNRVKKADGFVHNFWVGIATFTASALIITFISGWQFLDKIEIKFIAIALIMGCITLFMILMKLHAFKAGADLTLEVFVQQSSYLILVTISGILFFNEAFTIGKLIGIPGFMIAFTLANNEVWNYFSDKTKRLYLKAKSKI